MTTTESKQDDTKPKRRTFWGSVKLTMMYFSIYFAGIATFIVIISNPFTLQTYISDNSLLPGFANREFSLGLEAEYYYKDLSRLSQTGGLSNGSPATLATTPAVAEFIKKELDNFGLDVYEQSFNYKQYNGTNIYTIMNGERSTNSEALVLCAPYRVEKDSNTLAGISLSLALTKYFATKSYWAKDVIVLFVDQGEHGLTAWLDAYHDINFKNDLLVKDRANKERVHYDPLIATSGPIQGAIVLDLMGTKFSRMNIKIQGMFGQLPNLDLFNTVVEIATRETVTPYFYGKTLPYGSEFSTGDLYKHYLETAIEFMKSQASMKSDGLHGHFLRYSIQALTLEGPKYDHKSSALTASLLNFGRLVEGVFRSLNNLTERFNRSFYFYIILSLRRFTSIGYYMVAFGLLIAPILLRAHQTHKDRVLEGRSLGLRTTILLISALVLSTLSVFNISAALISATASVPILLLI